MVLNMLSVPGFIDLQFNGYLEIDFSSPNLTKDDFIRVNRKLLKSGCAACLPTVITSSEDAYQHTFKLISKVMELPEFKGRLLGIHAEGPFISPTPGYVGAHNPDWVRKPDIDAFKRMQEWANGTIKILTIAAEMPGAVELTEYATSQGVVVSMGHHNATAEDIKACADAGAKLLTHLGNGIANELNRHRNPIWAGLAEDQVSAMIITDGHHLPPELIKLFIRCKGLDSIIVTSDASALAGMPPGEYYSMGNHVVLEESGLLHNPEKQCLVGSSSTIIECVNYLATQKLLMPEEIIQAAYYNPLKIIGIDPAEIVTGEEYVYDEITNKFVKKM
jgi:N-acetylglucosamine-6-phosphate deacetylase